MSTNSNLTIKTAEFALLSDEDVFSLMKRLGFKLFKTIANTLKVRKDSTRVYLKDGSGRSAYCTDTYRYLGKRMTRRKIDYQIIDSRIAVVERDSQTVPEVNLIVEITPIFLDPPFSYYSRYELLRPVGFKPNYSGYKIVIRNNSPKPIHSIYMPTIRLFAEGFGVNHKYTE